MKHGASKNPTDYTSENESKNFAKTFSEMTEEKHTDTSESEHHSDESEACINLPVLSSVLSQEALDSPSKCLKLDRYVVATESKGPFKQLHPSNHALCFEDRVHILLL